MMSVEATLLLVIMICTLVTAGAILIGVVFLVRYAAMLNRVELRLEELSRSIEKEVTPTIREFGRAAGSLSGLLDASKEILSNMAFVSITRKVSPRLAGLKLGIDLAMRAYKTYLSTSGKKSASREPGR